MEGPHNQISSNDAGDVKETENSEDLGRKNCWHDMSPEEEDLIHRLHRLLGDRWALISGRLPNRQAEEIERYWKMRERRQQGNTKIFKPVCVRVKPPLNFGFR
ncbi:MYB-like transcription factor [Nymphaea thermarum]|nr:MYB-like transcription factor [Nymphaea thermarum]